MFRDFVGAFSASAVTAGLLAVVVSYSGPLAIVLQAAEVGNLTTAQLATWILAISLGSSVTGIYLSARFRIPIITAWSTPGAAVLVGSLAVFPFEQAVVAFMFSGALVTVLGFSNLFKLLVAKIPLPLASAMLAGVLFQFGVNLVAAAQSATAVVIPMVVIYFVLRSRFSAFALVGTLGYGLCACAILRLYNASEISSTTLDFAITSPEFSISAIFGIGVPLFLVVIASQTIPGIAVLEAAGYGDLPVKSILKATGLASVVLAPFGCHGISIAAITAAICTGPEANKNPQKRYIAGVFCGLFYLVFGSFGVSLVALMLALPNELISGIAGISLFAAMANSLSGSMKSEIDREPALVTFLVTVSGISMFGLSSAFWGLIAGLGLKFLLELTHGNLELSLKEPE